MLVEAVKPWPSAENRTDCAPPVSGRRRIVKLYSCPAVKLSIWNTTFPGRTVTGLAPGLIEFVGMLLPVLISVNAVLEYWARTVVGERVTPEPFVMVIEKSIGVPTTGAEVDEVTFRSSEAARAFGNRKAKAA